MKLSVYVGLYFVIFVQDSYELSDAM